MVQKILIYGGSGGVGSATGRILHARGYDLHLVGRNNEERLTAIARELGATATLGNVNDSTFFPERHKMQEQNWMVWSMQLARSICAVLDA